MLQPLFSLLIAGSFCWFVASSLWIYPHSLSYFNESIGGPLNGPKHLLGSNVDWGQDLGYIKKYSQENVGGSIQLVAFTYLDPRSLGIDFVAGPVASKDLMNGSNTTSTVVPYVLSVNFLNGFPGFAPRGGGYKIVIAANAFSLESQSKFCPFTYALQEYGRAVFEN